MTLKNYIGDKNFYKMTFTVAIPIMLQNFITNFVSMLDNLMVGALGTEPMSGVSIVNQILFVYNLAVFGAMGGVGIFTAQFYGKSDEKGMRYTVRYKLLVVTALFAAAALLLTFCGDRFISLFLHDVEPGADIAQTLVFGREYLAVMLWGLFPFAVANAFSGTLRETGDTLMPMIAGMCAVAVNCTFNWFLIFGKCGFPELGVKGAAIATVMSRYVECAVLIIYTFARRGKFTYIKGLFRGFSIPGELFSAFSLKGLPFLFNEIFWAGGMTVLNIAYSLHGLSVVAGVSISSTVTNLFNIAFMSLGVSIGIISGKLLGADKHKEAVDTVRKLIAFSFTVSVVVGIAMFFLGGKITSFYKTGEQSKQLATYFIRTCALITPVFALTNATFFTLRSGGKTIVTMLFDSGVLWGLSIPLAFLLYYKAHLDIHAVYPIIQALESIKMIIGLILVKKKVWVRTII